MDMASPPISSSTHSGFPITAAAIISILATGLLLVSYYVFVIKCCLNWDRVDFLRSFSISRRRRNEDPLMVYSSAVENQGLDESVIRSIPIFQYKKISEGSNATCECAVCLNEFQDDENLRVIPNCAHVFHIDCIDIWLQNNANCPLCRTSITLDPISSLQYPNPYRTDNFRDEDYVVIEIVRVQERLNSGELSAHFSISPSPRKVEPKGTRKKVKKLCHVSSMGDECIDIRKKDEQFTIQPFRRSFSMDSVADRQLYVAVQEIMQQQRQVTNISSSEGTSSRLKRSFFSFGHGRGSRNTTLPVHLEP